MHQDLTRLVTDRVTSRAKLIMSAAEKEDEKTRKKQGRGRRPHAIALSVGQACSG